MVDESSDGPHRTPGAATAFPRAADGDPSLALTAEQESHP